MAASRSFTLPRPRTVALPGGRRERLRLAAALLALLVLAGGGWLWLRDSSLVRASHVTVEGATGPQASAIRLALDAAAGDMTTLHVRHDVLSTAVEPFPIVKALEVTTHFPHGMTIRVVEHDPVAQIVVAGRHIPVAGDGTLLRGAIATGVPVVPLGDPPGGDVLTERGPLSAVHLLAAAPAALRAHVTKVFQGPRGLTVRLQNGPSVAFGDGERLAAKWMALAAVLADPSSAGTTSIDVRVPERPAAADLEQAASQESPTGDPTTVTTPQTAPDTTTTTEQP